MKLSRRRFIEAIGMTHDFKYTPGKNLHAYESDFGSFGVMICADRRWPETARTLTLQGARVIFNPTYGMHDDLNLCMMKTRSYENGIFIVFTHPGQSLITDPKGATLELPKGAFRAEWVNPIDGSIDKEEDFDHGGGRSAVPIDPAVSEDAEEFLAARLHIRGRLRNDQQVTCPGRRHRRELNCPAAKLGLTDLDARPALGLIQPHQGRAIAQLIYLAQTAAD